MRGYMMKRKGGGGFDTKKDKDGRKKRPPRRNLLKRAVADKWVTRYFVLHGDGRLVYYRDAPASLRERPPNDGKKGDDGREEEGGGGSDSRDGHPPAVGSGGCGDIEIPRGLHGEIDDIKKPPAKIQATKI